VDVAEGEDGEDVEGNRAIDQEFLIEGGRARVRGVEVRGRRGGEQDQDGEDRVNEADFFMWDQAQYRWEGECREGEST